MTEENLAGGNLPGFAATVQIDPDLALAVGAGEADATVICLEEIDVSLLQCGAGFSQLT